MYEIGQLIVYGNEGVCRVEEIGTPKISGVDKHRDYYTLAPIYREGKVFTPVDSKVFMRPVISREEALALIDRIPEMTAEVYENSISVSSMSTISTASRTTPAPTFCS